MINEEETPHDVTVRRQLHSRCRPGPLWAAHLQAHLPSHWLIWSGGQARTLWPNPLCNRNDRRIRNGADRLTYRPFRRLVLCSLISPGKLDPKPSIRSFHFLLSSPLAPSCSMHYIMVHRLTRPVSPFKIQPARPSIGSRVQPGDGPSSYYCKLKFPATMLRS